MTFVVMIHLHCQLLGRGNLTHHGNAYFKVYLRVYFQKYLTEEGRSTQNTGGFVPWDLTQTE